MLRELIAGHELGRWQYTDDVLISDGRWTFSHPILTISAGYVNREPDMLLCSYIHEQMHWFSLLERDDPSTLSITADLRLAFPALPIDPPAWCGSERSNLIHIEVCFLERQIVSSLIGHDRFHSAISTRLAAFHYSGMYELVKREGQVIEDILRRHNRLPPDRPPLGKRFATPRT